MYHCCVHFYLLGDRSEIFEIIKEMPPLEHFTHEFWESGEVDEALAAKANVILADLRELSSYFVRDVVMKAPNGNIMNALQKGVLTLFWMGYRKL